MRLKNKYIEFRDIIKNYSHKSAFFTIFIALLFVQALSIYTIIKESKAIKPTTGRKQYETFPSLALSVLVLSCMLLKKMKL